MRTTLQAFHHRPRIERVGENMRPFEVVSPFQPAGDQGEAIKALAEGIRGGDKYQTLQGITGSGKTFTMAKIVEAVQMPTLIVSHNKTLAAQLFREFRGFFPHNAVEQTKCKHKG